MKKIIRICMILAMVFCILPLPVHAEEAGEDTVLLDAKFHSGTKLKTFVEYMDKYGKKQNEKTFINKTVGSLDMYIFYRPLSNEMLLSFMDHKTGGTYDQINIVYSAETLRLTECVAYLRLGSTSKTGLYDDDLSIPDYMLTNVETFARSGTGGTPARADRTAANALLRKAVTQLDSYVASLKAVSGVSGLEELGFFALKSGEQLRAFVERLYNLCLGRAPDESGLSYWVKRLHSGEVTAAECVQGFFMSAEMKARNLTNEQFIDLCYKVIIGRPADAGGKAYWKERLDNGVSWMYVLKGFTESAEFSLLCRQYGISRGTLKLTEPRDLNYGITCFVSRCYTKCLGRKFDAAGLNNWCRKILESPTPKQTAIDVATNGFFHSAEFRKRNTTNEQYVAILYATFLDREPDSKGFTSWVAKLKMGMSRDKVLYGFANSAEFAKLMASYGIK